MTESITPDVPSANPDQTYQTLENAISLYRDVYIYDRTEYLSEAEANEVNSETDFLEMLDQLGYLHFIQTEEKSPPGFSVNPRTFYVYILSDGTVFFMQGETWYTKAIDARIYQPDAALALMSRVIYY